MATLAVVAVAAGAAAYAANEQRKSQKAANKANRENMDATNAANLEMFYESRGQGGSAFLPMYMKDQYGNPLEPILARDAVKLYDATAMSPQARMAQYQQSLGEMAAAQRGAEAAVGDIYSGNLEAQQIAAAQPVMQARTALAGAKKTAGLEALQATLNNIQAIQAKKGFVGDSSTTQRLNFDARRNVFGQNALDTAGANLTNAEDLRAIKNAAQNMRLSNVALPGQMARSKIDLQNLPENAAYDQNARRQQLFNFFRIGTGQFQYQPLPHVEPVASTGQIVGQAIASGAGAYGNMMANQSLAKGYGTQSTPQMTDLSQTSIGRNPNSQWTGGGAQQPGAYDWYGDYMRGRGY